MTVNQSGTVTTNPKRGSVASCSMTGVVPVTFKELWDNFENGPPPYKVNGKVPKGFENQCAIRLSKTLHNVGVEMKTFSSKFVTPEGKASTIGRILLNNKATSTRASEMAQWLDTRPVCGIGAKQDITGKTWKEKIAGKTGIIFFGEYWGRDGESSESASGGHIDLWNKNKLTGTGSYFRIQWGIVIDGIWSDFSRSKRIWFYEVK